MAATQEFSYERCRQAHNSTYPPGVRFFLATAAGLILMIAGWRSTLIGKNFGLKLADDACFSVTFFAC
jgi:hypothetical protein